MYAFKLCYRSVGAKPVSGKTDPVYGINKRTLSFVDGKILKLARTKSPAKSEPLVGIWWEGDGGAGRVAKYK